MTANRIFSEQAQTDLIRNLRNILELDVLPRLTNQSEIDSISEKFLAPANGRQQVSPRIIAIAGGPASGKNYLYDHMLAKHILPDNAVMHDPDLVMQSIEQYREDALINPAAAFAKWELPARQLAHEILLNAVLARYHIIYIRSFALPDSFNFVHAVKQLGYQIDIHLLQCDINIALTRAAEREKITKRHIPAETLIQRHQKVLQSIPEITSIADNYYQYENSASDIGFAIYSFDTAS